MFSIFKSKPAYEVAMEAVNELDELIKLCQASQKNASFVEGQLFQELIDETQLEREYKNQAFHTVLAEAVYRSLCQSGSGIGNMQQQYYNIVLDYLEKYKESKNISVDRLKQVLLGYLYVDAMEMKNVAMDAFHGVYFKHFKFRELNNHVINKYGLQHEGPQAYLDAYERELDDTIRTEFSGVLINDVFKYCHERTFVEHPDYFDGNRHMELKGEVGKDVYNQFRLLPGLLRILGTGRALIDGGFQPNLPSTDFHVADQYNKNLSGKLQAELPRMLFK